MDAYATTIRNLSCHKLSAAGVRKQYALLAPGTGASLERRSRYFSNLMGASFIPALSGMPYRVDLGFGKTRNEIRKPLKPIPPRVRDNKNKVFYCSDCKEIRQTHGIDHSYYNCRYLSKQYGNHVGNDVRALNDSLASILAFQNKQGSAYKNILIASQDLQGISTFCPSFAEITIEFPYLFANQGGDNQWTDSVSYSGCLSTLPHDGKVVICLPSEDLFDRFGEFTCTRPSAFQMNHYIRQIQKMVMILRGYNVEHLMLVGPMLRLPRKFEQLRECILLFHEVNKFLKDNLYGCDFLNPMEIFFPENHKKAPIGSMCGIYCCVPIFNTHFTWATKFVLMERIASFPIKKAPWNTMSIIRGESYWKCDSRPEVLRLPWVPIPKAKDNMVPYPELPPKTSSGQRTSLELDELDELIITISEEEESELYNSSPEDSSAEESPESNSLEERSIITNIDSPVKVLDWTTPSYVPQRRNCKAPCLHPLSDGCGKLTIKQRLGPPVNITHVKSTNVPKSKSTQGKSVITHKGGQSFMISAEPSTSGQKLNNAQNVSKKKKKKKRKGKNKQQNGLYLIQSQIQDFTTDYW